jgi:class 3 adenylate cyclase
VSEPRRHGLIEPLAEERAVVFCHLEGVGLAIGGTGGLVAAVLGRDEIAHPDLLLAVGIPVTLVGLVLIWLAYQHPQFAAEHLSFIFGIALFGTPTAVTLGQFALGPTTNIAVIYYVVMPIFAYFLMTPFRAWILVGVISVMYGALLALQDGYKTPLADWFGVTGAMVATCYVFGKLMKSAAEEAERGAQLRRFLAPYVAEAVLSGEGEDVLAPHRREIAVFFCDLRGFTNFAARAEPEDVLAVLNEYYAAVGDVLHKHGATIGDYIGDGIMAYLNDPLPIDDPAGTAVQMATEARDELLKSVVRWTRNGHDLSFGIGVAFGHATLGVVGFSERHTYAPLGTVVNLAARLCGAATNGEILVDRRAAAQLPDGWQARADQVALKGLGEEVTVFRVPAAPVAK